MCSKLIIRIAFAGLTMICLSGYVSADLDCNNRIETSENQHSAKIETMFDNCGEDKECLKSVQKKAQKHPYLNEYKQCKDKAKKAKKAKKK